MGGRRFAVFRTLVGSHVQEEEGDGGERGGVDGKRPEQGGGQPARENPPTLALDALPRAVHDTAVLKLPAHPVGLEAGLDHVHGVRRQPRRDSRHAACKQQFGNHVRVLGLAAQRARQQVVRQEVNAEAGGLSDQGGHHAPVDPAQTLALVDASQAVQRVFVQLPRGLLLAGALHLHAGLGQFHGTADDALYGAGRRPGQKLIQRRVLAQPAHGVALDTEDDGVDKRQAHHGRPDAFIKTKRL